MSRIDPSTRGTPGGVPVVGRFQWIGTAMILEGRQPSTQVLSCIRTPGLSGRYLQRRRIHANRASVPVVTAAATAPAVFDGSASGLRLRRCPQIFLHDFGREPDTFERHPRGSGDPVTFAFITGKSKADPSLRSG